ncbi:MAG TPA: BfmA/BtgA family mobilization protein [Arenibacter sp.]|nr:BfmA/BtgA family mobilization protein [Arenibacter sp.]
MDTFIGIRFKKKTAQRFQEFSRTHFRSHTETMEAILDFFLYNEISPMERFGPTGRTIEANLMKRINAVIAIMRDVEKTQTKPTAAMIASLFQAEETPAKPLILERKFVEEQKKDDMDENKNRNFKL